MKLVKRKVWAGVTLDQEVMIVSDPKDGDIRKARPKLRFKSEEEREEHREKMALKRFIRLFNATFRPGDLYATLTFDDDHEVHTFAEARRVRDAYWRRLRRRWPEAAMCLVMGRGKSTSRIHFHLVAQGMPGEGLTACWSWGMVLEPIRVLREHNFYMDAQGNKVDHGADFRGLAVYLFRHWTAEQGGCHYKATRNMRPPDREERTQCNRRYTEANPPKAPKGYLYIGCDVTPWGYACYHYVLKPEGNGLELAGDGRWRQPSGAR